MDVVYYLKEMDEVAQDQSVELREGLHHCDGCYRVVIVTDTLLVEIHGNKRLLQLPIPQLHQRGWERRTTVKQGRDRDKQTKTTMKMWP